MLTRSLIYSSFIILFFSCGEAELEPILVMGYETCNVSVPDCNPADFTPSTFDIQSINASECHIDIGEIDLLEKSKEFLWFTCDAVNELIYTNELGNETVFEVRNLVHKQQNRERFDPTTDCSTGMTYESIDEFMELDLVNEQFDIHFKVSLAPSARLERTSDFLEVRRKVNELQYDRMILIVINEDSNLTTVHYNFYGSKTILGETYNDVYFTTQPDDEIFYNQSCGLIAFKDDDNILWRFKGFR